ncbi:hypothetical protein L1049_015047 [Liquidambar formosana]|uniref:Diacylglycerol O-acyltransferase n=1 Tax=Liquidambar formosana TaxID=63359 RepID=A0AAP0RXG8_LIQFO
MAMDLQEAKNDEPLTPTGRLFLSPELHQVITGAMGVKDPIDISLVKSEITNFFLTHDYPRLSCLLVRDHNGVEYWRKTHVDVDRHIVVVDSPSDGDSEDAVNEYLADLAVSSPLSTDKPLWEIHLLMAQNCVVFRVHHALGDGISLMSLFLSFCRKADDPNSLPDIVSYPGNSTNSRGMYRRERGGLWAFVKVVWFTVVFVVGLIGRILWVRDKRTAVSGGAGVELWPRKLVTAKFLLEDMKVVKKAIPEATINDVLFGMISSGLSRYLELRSAKSLQEGLQITGVAMVNIRQQPGLQDVSSLMRNNSKARWGNKFGMILLPTYYHRGGNDPLQYLKTAKAMINRKKLSLEAHFSYKIGDFVLSVLGLKAVSLLNYRILCNTTFTISNLVGPREKLTIAGNPVTYLRANNSSLPHAITMHMASYAGRADMQIMVARDIIPDPKVLAKCFEDALLEIKEAAAAVAVAAAATKLLEENVS